MRMDFFVGFWIDNGLAGCLTKTTAIRYFICRETKESDLSMMLFCL